MQAEIDFSPICVHAKHILANLSPLLTAEHLPVSASGLRTQLLYFVEAIIYCHRAFIHTMAATRIINLLSHQQIQTPVTRLHRLKNVMERLIVAYDNMGDAYKICVDLKASLEMLLAPALQTHGSSIIQLPLVKDDTTRSTIIYTSVQTLIGNIIRSLDEFPAAVRSYMAWLLRFRSLMDNEDVVLPLHIGHAGPLEGWNPVGTMFYHYDSDLRRLRDTYPAFFPPKIDSEEIGESVLDDFISRQQRLEVPTPKIRLRPEEVPEDIYARGGHEFNIPVGAGQEFYKAKISDYTRLNSNISKLEFYIDISPGPDKLLSSVIVLAKFRPKDATLDLSVVRVADFRPRNNDDFLAGQIPPTIKPGTCSTQSSSPGCIEWHLGKRWTQFFSKSAFPTHFYLDLSLEHSVDVVIEVDIIVTHRRGLQRKTVTQNHPSTLPALISGSEPPNEYYT